MERYTMVLYWKMKEFRQYVLLETNPGTQWATSQRPWGTVFMKVDRLIFKLLWKTEYVRIKKIFNNSYHI